MKVSFQAIQRMWIQSKVGACTMPIETLRASVQAILPSLFTRIRSQYGDTICFEHAPQGLCFVASKALWQGLHECQITNALLMQYVPTHGFIGLPPQYHIEHYFVRVGHVVIDPTIQQFMKYIPQAHAAHFSKPYQLGTHTTRALIAPVDAALEAVRCYNEQLAFEQSMPAIMYQSGVRA